jgi:hypothetical protein
VRRARTADDSWRPDSFTRVLPMAKPPVKTSGLSEHRALVSRNDSLAARAF